MCSLIRRMIWLRRSRARLTAGRVLDAQIDATLLDLARRGIIAMEPDDDEALAYPHPPVAPSLSGYERQLFSLRSPKLLAMMA